MKLNTTCLLISSALLFTFSARAEVTNKTPYNPIVTHQYTADPTARVINGKLYVYPSSDMVCPEGKGSNGFCMPGYNVFSSTDMTSWTDHGNVINHNTVPWVEKDSYGMWAPDTIEHKGKFYMFYPGVSKSGEHFREIGVAVADHPEGPFVARENYIKGTEGIDPSPFIDDDGRIYLYWGGGENLNVVELNQDMTKIISKPQRLEGLPPKYKEGPFMFKRNGIYYFTFPHAPNGSEEIAYGTATNPLGPITYKGKILERWKDGQWTNHHSIVEFNDQWYIFYHHNDVSQHKNLRSMSVDRLYFDAEGNIPFIPSTKRGVGYVSAEDVIQVDRYTKLKNVRVTPNLSDGKPNWALHNIAKSGEAVFGELDFADKSYVSAVAYVSSSNEGAKIHVSDAQGKKIASFEVPKTGENTWQAIKTDVLYSPKGMQDLHFTFEGNVSKLKFDWLRFLQARESMITLTGNTQSIAKIDGATTLTNDNPSYINTNPFLRIADIRAMAFDDEHDTVIKLNGESVELRSIQQIVPGSVVNIETIAPQQAPRSDEKLAAANFNKTKGVQTENAGNGMGNIGYIENGDSVTYESINFKKAVRAIEISASSATKGGQVEVRLGGEDGELLATIEVQNTGTWQQWKSFSAPISTKLSQSLKGEKEITLVFKGGNGYLLNVQWLRFN
jgi:hypothetical protein